ncbi:MAG TPA: hypothetical protein VGJ29_18725 [Vicinamibacterales bacterium]|jgi:hypothetical protein
MFVVRYLALLALVFWLGVMLNETSWIRPAQLVGLACGAVLLVSLTALKFLGPPPHAFFSRAAIVSVMLAVAIFSPYIGRNVPTAINLVLGIVLLAWYARE